MIYGKDAPEIWRALGEEIKRVDDELLKIICNGKYNQILTRRELEPLIAAHDHIWKFKAKAEERMNTKYGIDDSNIFYGDRRVE